MTIKHILRNLEQSSLIRLDDGTVAIIRDGPSNEGPHRHELNIRLKGGAVRSIPAATEVELIASPYQIAIAQLEAT